MNSHIQYMNRALALAETAREKGEVPVGAVIVKEGEIIGEGYNLRENLQDPLAHAEILAIRSASEKIGSWRLEGCSIYVTLEPCAMCAGAIVLARIETLVFGTRDPKAGYCGTLGNLVQDHRLNHRVEVVEGVFASECSSILSDFFKCIRSRGER